MVLDRPPLPLRPGTITRNPWSAEGRFARGADFDAAAAAGGCGAKLPVRERSATVDLGDPAGPIDGADFLRLRLTVRYGPLWKLRKPERLQLEITRADGSTRTAVLRRRAECLIGSLVLSLETDRLGALFRRRGGRLARQPTTGDHSSASARCAAGLVFAAARLNRSRVSRSGADVAKPIARS